MSQYRFGLMYARGLGVSQNNINAYAWLTVAGHYFIYELAEEEKHDYETEDEHKREILLFQKEEKDRVLNEIINHLQALRPELTESDVEEISQKVINYSKYRKKYRKISIRDGRLEHKIENLFLPETLLPYTD